MTDNRANEEIARDAIYNMGNLDLSNLSAQCSGAVVAALEAAGRLVAAQGAAPQAEGAPKSSYISPSLPAMIRNLWKSDPSENSVRTALKLAGDLIQELIDLKAAPVLPSSGVDEEKLAEVLLKHSPSATDRGGFAACRCDRAWRSREGNAAHLARAVAAWLKGQGR